MNTSVLPNAVELLEQLDLLRGVRRLVRVECGQRTQCTTRLRGGNIQTIGGPDVVEWSLVRFMILSCDITPSLSSNTTMEWACNESSKLHSHLRRLEANPRSWTSATRLVFLAGLVASTMPKATRARAFYLSSSESVSLTLSPSSKKRLMAFIFTS